MKIALAQYPITGHNNLTDWQTHTAQWVQTAANNQAQVLVFPEYGSMELASLLSDEIQKSLPRQITELQTFLPVFLKTYSDLAAEYKVCILAPSFAVIDPNFVKPVNRAYFFFADGSYKSQDKHHMTRFEDETWGVGPGHTEQIVFDAFGVQFGVAICFDVEFPFAPHELAKKGVQVLLVPSCTETMKGVNRVHVGSRARALENQFYVAISQTVGDAPWSEAIDTNTGLAACYSTCDVGFPDDGIMMQGELNKAGWSYCDVDVSLIERVRTHGQVFNFKWMHKPK